MQLAHCASAMFIDQEVTPKILSSARPQEHVLSLSLSLSLSLYVKVYIAMSILHQITSSNILVHFQTVAIVGFRPASFQDESFVHSITRNE